MRRRVSSCMLSDLLLVQYCSLSVTMILCVYITKRVIVRRFKG